MRKIPLTKGYFTFIDDEDFERVTQYKWSALETKWGTYAMRNTSANGKKKNVYLHRFLLGDPIGFAVDHANGDTLDNRRSNIRLCTASQNQWNQKLSKRNKSGYKGVCFDKDKHRWRTQIVYHGTRVVVGYFETKELAARAYNATAVRLYGEFARLNIVSEGM